MLLRYLAEMVKSDFGRGSMGEAEGEEFASTDHSFKEERIPNHFCKRRPVEWEPTIENLRNKIEPVLK